MLPSTAKDVNQCLTKEQNNRTDLKKEKNKNKKLLLKSQPCLTPKNIVS